MHRTLKLIMMASVTAAAGCADSGTGPTTEFDGIKYTAAVAPIVGTAQFTVIVTLKNTSGVQQTRTYPAGCPVLIRLYRTGDDALVYRETMASRGCNATPTATVTVDAFSSNTLQSGVRIPSTIAGDSLPRAAYTVRAEVKTESSTVLVLCPGTLQL